MGFGHRVYKSYDPRAKVIKRIADLVFTVTGKNPLLEIALELERIALQDDYFVTRKLYPERRLLLGPHLPGDGLPGRDVPGALRDPADGRLDRAVGGDAARPRAEDRPAAADLHRADAARLRAAGRNGRRIAGSRDGQQRSSLWRSRFRPSRPRRRSSTPAAPGNICGSWSPSARGRPARRPSSRPASTSRNSSPPPASPPSSRRGTTRRRSTRSTW